MSGVYMKRIVGYLGLFFSLCSGIFSVAYGQSDALPRRFPQHESYWDEAMLMTMTLDEKIAQLIMVPVYSAPNRFGGVNVGQVEQLIRQYKIGGVIFMQGTPSKQAYWNNYFQKISDIPILVGFDGEWGLSMRLDSTVVFPKNMTLGAITNDSLLYAFGREMALHCRAVGIHVNFAPVVDVNNNPANPVINDRSFGDDPDAVARRAIMVMRGMQDFGVMANAKHFPGHGDTDADSHYDLPVIRHSMQRLHQVELAPFKTLIREGVLSVMVAHLQVPAIDPTPNTPTTLSKAAVQDLLRDSMGFHGLTFTDALGMHGVTKHHAPGDIEVKALQAGNDILLFCENVPLAIRKIKEAIANGLMTEAQLDDHVRRVLIAKAWLAIDRSPVVDLNRVQSTLHAPSSYALRNSLYRAALTVAKNQDQLVPLTNLAPKKIAYVQIGANGSASPAFHRLKLHFPVQYFHLPSYAGTNVADTLIRHLKANYNTVILALHDLKRLPNVRYGVTETAQYFCNQITPLTGFQSILVVFGSPYALRYFGAQQSVMVAYEDVPETQIASADAIAGSYRPTGVLPVRINNFSNGPVLVPNDVQRFSFADPEAAGFNTRLMGRIDTIAQYWINEKAMPGCVVMVGRGNDIVMAKSYGKLEYQNSTPADAFETHYDLASLTKVCATTLAIMRLYDQDSIALDHQISKYLSDMNGRIGKLTIRQLLEHRSGLPSYIPFYQKLVVNKRADPSFFSNRMSEHFSIPLAPDLFLHRSAAIEAWRRISSLKVDEKMEPLYSDINMIILAKVVEMITRMPIDQYVDQHFYRPLGMNHTVYNPALKGLGAAPTEVDRFFRFRKIEGYVNDENAAVLGGVAGHAGLFSNGYDLAKLCLMLKNGGQYGGTQFLQPSTIAQFTKRISPQYRRGLGWDKPEIDPSLPQPTADRASPNTFGHLGFTGTALWIDPDNDLFYVMLANRTFPDRDNNLFARASVRVKVMEAIYRAIQPSPAISLKN
jgi:beta-N-acetylhexosaminidase